VAPVRRPTQPAPWWAVIGVFVASVSLGLANNTLTVRAEARARKAADLQWCSLIKLEDNNYRAEPPTNDTGRARAKIYAELRRTRCAD
jgi:hypothetical protein